MMMTPTGPKKPMAAPAKTRPTSTSMGNSPAPIAKSKEALMKYGKTAGPMPSGLTKAAGKAPAMNQTSARAKAGMGAPQSMMKKPGFKNGGMCAPKKGKK